MARGDRLQLPGWAYLLIGNRDQWKCRVCGDGYRTSQEYAWEIDHWIPLAKGGTNHISNLVLAHKRCNRDKAAA